jgi:hypothetical protein
MRKIQIAGLILGACLAMALPASAAGWRRGRMVIAPSFYTWGWYEPFPYGLYDPYGAYPPIYSNAGEVHLKTNVKDADVYINGAYAGKAGKLKTMWLRAAAYSLEVRTPGHSPFTERIYVVPGKTVKVETDFSSAPHS